ncbi:Zinc finger protein [Dirofilaria immitis]
MKWEYIQTVGNFLRTSRLLEDMEIVCLRNVLARAVTSRNLITLLIRNTRLATGGTAQAPLPLEKSASKTSETKEATTASTKIEKSENVEQTPTISEKKQEVAMQTSSVNDAKGMELSDKSAVDEKTAQLPLEPGKPSPLPHRDGEKVVSERILRLANEIVNLTIFEIADLNSTLKKKLNLPDAPVFAQSFAVSAASAPDGREAKMEKTDASQKTFFSVKLTKIDQLKKIPLIKEIRATVEGFNLVQAKKFVETLPATVKQDLSKTEAEELKEKLEKLGAGDSAGRERSLMARGHQKFQSQQKNLKKQEELKKSKGNDQKAAAIKALTHKCTVCMALMPDPKTYKQHFESKHPKAALPPELY